MENTAKDLINWGALSRYLTAKNGKQGNRFTIRRDNEPRPFTSDLLKAIEKVILKHEKTQKK